MSLARTGLAASGVTSMANPAKPTAAMATAMGTPKAITANRTTTLSPPNSPGLIGPPLPAPGFAADNHSPAPWVHSLRSTRPRRSGERPWPAPLLHRLGDRPPPPG